MGEALEHSHRVLAQESELLGPQQCPFRWMASLFVAELPEFPGEESGLIQDLQLVSGFLI